jgi:hypothetical protein
MGKSEDYVGGWDVVGRQEYKRLTLEVIGKIVRNDVGRIVLRSIDRIAKNVIISARTAEDIKRGGACNAEALPDSEKDAYTVGDERTLFKGTTYDPTKTGSKDVRFERVAHGFKGTGKGSDVSISFDPDDGGCFDDHTLPSSGYDEMLMHELVHALRQAQGLVNHVPTQDYKYDNVEEFLAIVVTNVYISAKGSHRFRADHMGATRLPPALSTSAGFIHDSHNFLMLNKFRRTWLETFAQLAQVKTHFNPFREILHYPPNAVSTMAHRSHGLRFQHVSASH